tara:strand:+ start:68 stop:298 length:231 start_codon:yes stop_codon:yes gene_type:complete
MPDKQETQDKIEGILKDQFSLELEDSSILTEHLDPVRYLDFIIAIEQDFDVDLNDDLLEEVVTFDDLVNLVGVSCE